MTNVPDPNDLRGRVEALHTLAADVRAHHANAASLRRLAELVDPTWLGHRDLAGLWARCVDSPFAFVGYWVLTRPVGSVPCPACLNDMGRTVARVHAVADGSYACDWHLLVRAYRAEMAKADVVDDVIVVTLSGVAS